MISWRAWNAERRSRVQRDSVSRIRTPLHDGRGNQRLARRGFGSPRAARRGFALLAWPETNRARNAIDTDIHTRDTKSGGIDEAALNTRSGTAHSRPSRSVGGGIVSTQDFT